MTTHSDPLRKKVRIDEIKPINGRAVYSCSICGEVHHSRKSVFVGKPMKCNSGCVRASVTVSPCHIKRASLEVNQEWDEDTEIKRGRCLPNFYKVGGR